MNWKSHTVYIVAFAVVLACALIAGRQWAEHVRDDAKRDAVIDQSKKSIQAAQDQRMVLENKLEAVGKQGNAKLEQLQSQLEQIKRDHVAAKREIEAVVGEPVDPAPLPDAPSKVMVLNDDQQLKLAETLNGCKQTEVENDTCQLESSLKTELLARADEQVKAAKDGMNAALKASKGGAWYQRTWRVIKPIGCGAAGAGIGALIAGAKGAVIGSAGSGVGCAIFGR